MLNILNLLLSVNAEEVLPAACQSILLTERFSFLGTSVAK